MGVLDRMGTLIRANVNDMLDRAEDPEKMLNQILRDMANQIQEARGQVATMMAQENMLEAQLEDARDDVGKWEGRAERMVRAGNDPMAREALRGKQEAEQHISMLEGQLESQRSMVQQLRNQLDALERKYQSAQGNRDMLIARYRRAKAQQQMTQATTATDTAHDYGSDLDRMEDRVRQAEAVANAQSELAADSAGAAPDWGDEYDEKVEDELAALKQRLGSGGDQGGQSGQTVKM